MQFKEFRRVPEKHTRWALQKGIKKLSGHPKGTIVKRESGKKLENIMWKEKQNIGEESLRQQKL